MQKKSTERRRLSKPIDVVQALHEAGKELSGDDLFIAAGYPSDADSELIEAYFVDIRDALQENKISRVRRGNMDWFSLV
jgi:type I restriction enzyme S subunit